VVISGCSGQRANAVWGSLGYDAASTAVSGAVVYGLNEMMSPSHREVVSQTNVYPILFTAKNDNLENIGKQIFYSGEGVYVIGNFNGILPKGTRIANKNVYLNKGLETHFVEKSVKVGEYGDLIRGKFDAQDLVENYGTGEYENTWYAWINGEWKEIGSVRYAIFDNKQTSKK